MYEVKGEQAEFEKEVLRDFLEGIKYAESNVGKPNAASEVFAGSWREQVERSRNLDRSLGGRGDFGNAGVLLGKSERKPSAAFESVLRNLFQVQETESVKSDLAALGVEKVKGTAGKSKGSAL